MAIHPVAKGKVDKLNAYLGQAANPLRTEDRRGGRLPKKVDRRTLPEESSRDDPHGWKGNRRSKGIFDKAHPVCNVGCRARLSAMY